MVTKFEVVHSELDQLDQLVNDINIRQSTAKAPDLGRLSAEAVQASYHAAAKAVEELKGPIMDRTQKLEEALKGCDEAMKALDEWIKKIHDTGHLVALQIEEANALSGEMIKMSTEFIAKVK
jgi:hypothetical protein